MRMFSGWGSRTTRSSATATQRRWSRGADRSTGCAGPASTALRSSARSWIRAPATGGSARLTDLMPVASEDDKRRLLLADHEVLRVVECDEGEVAIDFDLCARPGYGRGKPRVTRSDRLGLRIALDPGLLSLRSELPLEPDPDDPGRVRGRARLRAG